VATGGEGFVEFKAMVVAQQPKLGKSIDLNNNLT
jgi:hypothetical protein